MEGYEKFEHLLSEIHDFTSSSQEFGHSMKVSPELGKAIELLEVSLANLTDVACLVEEAYGL